jgi:hypothetical protein
MMNKRPGPNKGLMDGWMNEWGRTYKLITGFSACYICGI